MLCGFCLVLGLELGYLDRSRSASQAVCCTGGCPVVPQSLQITRQTHIDWLVVPWHLAPVLIFKCVLADQAGACDAACTASSLYSSCRVRAMSRELRVVLVCHQ